MEKRLFIVSNRLPVTVQKNEGKISVEKSSGGLVTAIESFLASQDSSDFSKTFWVGTPCCDVGDWNSVLSQLTRDSHEYVPVYITRKIYDQYYNGFSNSTVWPLFHYFPSFTEYNSINYSSYEAVNICFADTLQKVARPNDVIWIHDYHLLPLAALLRERIPGITIGFFLHIPFPSFELFRLLPKQWQQNILNGILGADLIGFHTMDYASHFLKSVQMVLGLENDLNIITYHNRLVKVDVFPISIDFEKFHTAYQDIGVARQRDEIRNSFPGKKIIFSIDRLDYTKGVSHRLEGFRLFLEKNPQYKEKVVFVMVIIPSREYIPRYSERKKMIDETISNINSKIGTIQWQPVIYQYSSLSFEQLTGLYTTCDLALITPLRDGMNLVAKEFVASRFDKKGVLLLSEMAGAARELTTALQINPNDVDEIATSIKIGLEMKDSEQKFRLEAMQARIQGYNVTTWATDFISQLNLIKHKQLEFQIKFIDIEDKTTILNRYSCSQKRLLLLDYDGTLISYISQPLKAKPGKDLKELLHRLSDNGNEIYLISGRNSSILSEWFDDIPVNLVAEHGARIRHYGSKWKTLVQVKQGWNAEIRRIMEQYVKRCANSFIEEKEFCLVWHYRNCNQHQADVRVKELYAELIEASRHVGMQVMMGNKIVEVRPNNADKATVIKNHIINPEYDFIFAAGDDKTDEDMFRLLCEVENAFTVKVGPQASFAKYNLLTPQMVIALLTSFASYSVQSAKKKAETELGNNSIFVK